MEHHAQKVSLGETGDTVTTGRGETQGGSNVLQGGGTGYPTVQVGYMVPLGGHGEEFGRYTH